MSNQTLCTTQGLKFRWINGQCFEFVFPNGKVLLSDPYFDDNEHFPVGKGMNLQNFHVEDIERVDYLFVNHTHFAPVPDGRLQNITDMVEFPPGKQKTPRGNFFPGFSQNQIHLLPIWLTG